MPCPATSFNPDPTCTLATARHSKSLQFSPLSPQEIVNLSEFESTLRELYHIDERGQKTVQKNGVLDGRLVGGADGRSLSAPCDAC